MSPEDVKPEWAETGGEVLHSRLYWSSITFAEFKAAAAEVLAAVLPEAMAEAWEKGYAASDYEAYHLGTHGRTDNPYEES
jgi:hypothetical protein